MEPVLKTHAVSSEPAPKKLNLKSQVIELELEFQDPFSKSLMQPTRCSQLWGEALSTLYTVTVENPRQGLS